MTAFPEGAQVPVAPTAMRVCIIYDCRYPVSHGGAEKWLGSLARALASRGARVTYVHGAGRGEEQRDGVRWFGLCDASDLCTPAGVRRSLPVIRFSWRVARYLRNHHRDFDLVYVHDMPILPVLGAWWGLRGAGKPWLVEWIEWWSVSYWQSYAGVLTGIIGYLSQRLALRVTPLAACYSDLTAEALRAVRPRIPIARLPGQADCPSEALVDRATLEERVEPPRPPLAIFLGRFMAHKRAELAVDAVVRARAAIPGLRMILIGHGPEEVALRRRVAAIGGGAFEVRVGASDAAVHEALSRASVLVHPSAREGFGLVVPEANSLGVPVVLVNGPFNAAPELIREGGGITVANPDAQELSDAIIATIKAGRTARQGALANAERLHRDRSVARTSEELLDLALRLRQLGSPDQ
jgi:glycosyltransferase involved in cell wall biosynthesis